MKCVDDVVVAQGHVLFRNIRITLLPVVALEIKCIVVLAVCAVVVILVTATPVVVIGMEEDVVFGSDVFAAVIRINAMTGAELVVDDISHELLAIAERGAGETLCVNASTIREQQHVIEDQVVGNQVILREVCLSGLLDLIGPASPAHGNSRIGSVVNLVILHQRPLRVAYVNSNATVILGCDVLKMIVEDPIVPVNLAARCQRQID